MQVLNEPEEVVNAIFDYYETKGFEHTPEEEEIQMNL